MSKVEIVLVGFGLFLLALAAALLVVHGHGSGCVDLLTGGCEERGFAYEGGGKLALLLAFVLFLAAALHGVFRHSNTRAK